jgi:hypothetical protein
MRLNNPSPFVIAIGDQQNVRLRASYPQSSLTSAIAIDASKQPTRIVIVMIQLRGTAID